MKISCHKPNGNLRKHSRIATLLWFSLSGFTVSMNANADLSWFSRANCVNNESITWHAFNPEWLWTNTYHYKNGTYLHCDNNIGIAVLVPPLGNKLGVPPPFM